MATWEPVPWQADHANSERQRYGFDLLAAKAISWQKIDFICLPPDGISTYDKAQLISIEACCFAMLDDEDLLLLNHAWFGWPDPPRWGLISRPAGKSDLLWSQWGRFAPLPTH